MRLPTGRHLLVERALPGYNRRMNPQITPEIRNALEQHPVGPVRLSGDSNDEPVYLVRLDDIAALQELADSRVRDALTKADEDMEANQVIDWNPQDLKQLGRQKLSEHESD